MPREASTRALAGAQHEAPGTPWAPYPATSAKLAKAQPCCKELLVPPSPKTAPSCSITPTAAPTSLVSKPTGQWHSRWCRACSIRPALLLHVPVGARTRARLTTGTLQITASFPSPSMSLQAFPNLEQLGRETGRQTCGCHCHQASSSQARGNHTLELV